MKRVTKCPESQIFVVVIGEMDEGGVGMPILPTLVDVLENFADRMSDLLPNVLPPRCIVDHCIELESEMQPQDKNPYQLSRYNLEELRW
jgi:hypothetical protein